MPVSACILYTTTSKLAEARQLSGRLLENRLAACVQISSPVESSYVWKGKICRDKEYVVAVKTKKSLLKKAEALILKHHSYETPQILVVPVQSMSAGYQKWFSESCG